MGASPKSLNNKEERQVPEGIKVLLTSILRENEKVICSVAGDLDEEGNFGERWLFLTTRRVIVVSLATKRVVEFQLNDIRSCFVKDYLGNSEIFFETSNGLKSVMRFSRDCLESFYNVAKLIDKIARKDISPEEVNPEILEEFLPKKSSVKKTQAFIWLMSFLKPYAHYVILAVILSLSITALNLTPPYLMKLLLDEVFAKRNLSMLIYIVAAFISIYALNAALGAAQNYTLSYLGQKLIYNIRVKVYEHIQRLSLGFYDRMSSGRIMTRVTDDVGRVQWFLTWGTQTLITSTLQIIGIGIIIFSMNIYLAIFALLPIPIIVVGVPLFRKRAHRAYHKVWRRWADVSSLLWDTIPGIVVVKSFTQEKFEIKRLVERLGNLVIANLKVTLLHIKFFPLLGFAISSGTAIVWWIGGQEVLRENISLGSLVAFVSYMGMFYGPVQTISNLFEPLQSSLTSSERILEIMQIEPEIKDAPDAVEFQFKGSIMFRNVSFGYNPYIPVLSNINLEIKPGEKIGIVGPSGSGKTTLTKLLLRFYDPTEGSIYIDGVDLRKIKLQCLRSQIGLVLQDPLLFYGSIAYNIAYGKQDAAPEEIIAAAKAANVHEFAMNQPLAYDTNVGDRGWRLSGGERQRVSIARAIITEPKILILDEATSSVDTLTEKKIQEAMENLAKGRTTIIIAHRLSTLQNVDRIVVMDKGRIVEVGAHEELMKAGGLYSQLYKAQFAEETAISALQR